MKLYCFLVILVVMVIQKHNLSYDKLIVITMPGMIVYTSQYCNPPLRWDLEIPISQMRKLRHRKLHVPNLTVQVSATAGILTEVSDSSFHFFSPFSCIEIEMTHNIVRLRYAMCCFDTHVYYEMTTIMLVNTSITSHNNFCMCVCVCGKHS